MKKQKKQLKIIQRDELEDLKSDVSDFIVEKARNIKDDASFNDADDIMYLIDDLRELQRVWDNVDKAKDKKQVEQALATICSLSQIKRIMA